MDTDALVALVRHGPVLKILREEPLDRRDLQEQLDVSRPTVHRHARALDDQGLVTRSEGKYTLTALGEVIAELVTKFEQDVTTAQEVEPVFEAVRDQDPAVDLGAFTNATVTTAEPGDPYRGVKRFMSLVNETDTLRGIDPTTINPLHIDEIYTRIVEGMETDAVFLTAVVEELLVSNPDRAQTAFESGNLMLRVHDDLPFGLTLCDERIGIGIYDDTTGLLGAYVDTDAPAAREWAEEVYATYRTEATPIDEHDELSQLPPVQPLVDNEW